MPVSTENQPLSEPVPIREVSRLTGVNSITLRAWERRYGLLKPLRTAKGHRLYGAEDIARVQAIQAWLKRGLAIGKIKDILAGVEPDPGVEQLDAQWQAQSTRLREALATLNRGRLEAQLAELTREYPLEVLADALFAPLLAMLLPQSQTQAPFSSHCQWRFLQALLAEHFYPLLRRQRQQAQGPRLLLLADAIEGRALILATALCVKGFRVECLSALSVAEAVFAGEQLQAQAVVVYADQHRAELPQQLAQLRQHLALPVWLAGSMSTLYSAQEADTLGLLGESQQAVCSALQDYFRGQA